MKKTFWDLGENFYQNISPQPLQNSFLIHQNQALISKLSFDNEDFLAIVSGEKSFNQPAIAQVYAGHQFGHFVPQLGDGRSCLIGISKGYEISLKGAGQTPFSRMGDGRAVLRSSIREYLCSIAMVGLNIPTTEALSLVGSEEQVWREQIETGAIVSRVAKSHIRFGNFEFFAAKGDIEAIKTLADFVIEQHYPQHTYAEFFTSVVKKTAKMIAKWQSVGFNHGVMNSDNMSILGLTLDYGPFAFLETYEPQYICNHTDQQGRYAFDKQPSIGLWNLQRLADSLHSLIKVEELTNALKQYQTTLVQEYSKIMRQKLGLKIKAENDNELLTNFLKLLFKNKLDYTNSFRQLSDYEVGKSHQFPQDFDDWFDEYQQRLKLEKITNSERQQQMKQVNPKYILRNYLAQIAIEKAQNNDFTEVENLFKVLENPFDEWKNFEHYTLEAPENLRNMVLSCSS